jgi:1,4-alpha-glucan branching enzyme
MSTSSGNAGAAGARAARRRRREPVGFRVAAEPGSEVFVAGTFNNWDPRRHPMRDDPDSRIYRTAIVLPRGRHEYKFVVNGEWRVDPACPRWVPNRYGSLNSVVTV